MKTDRMKKIVLYMYVYFPCVDIMILAF